MGPPSAHDSIVIGNPRPKREGEGLPRVSCAHFSGDPFLVLGEFVEGHHPPSHYAKLHKIVVKLPFAPPGMGYHEK